MDHVLSKEELHFLQPYLLDFDPFSLATVIWNAIQGVGHDNKKQGFGILFSTGLEGEYDKNSTVTFWDELGVNQLSRKMFLEILQFIGKFTMNNISESCCNCGMKGSSQMICGFHRLKLTLDELNDHLILLTDEKNSSKCNSGNETTNSSGGNKTVQRQSTVDSESAAFRLQLKSDSCDWFNSDDDVFHNSPACNTSIGTGISTNTSTSTYYTVLASSSTYTGHAGVRDKCRISSDTSPKGIEAVVQRMPGLRGRYEKSLSVPLESGLQQRALGKLKALSMLTSGAHASLDANDELNSVASRRSSSCDNILEKK